MKRYSAGSLDRRATIQIKTETQDERGAVTEDWQDYEADVPCAVESAGSREFPLSIKRFTESTKRFVFRYRDDLNPLKMRIAFQESPDLSPPVTEYFDMFPAQHIQERRSYTAVEAKDIK